MFGFFITKDSFNTVTSELLQSPQFRLRSSRASFEIYDPSGLVFGNYGLILRGHNFQKLPFNVTIDNDQVRISTNGQRHSLRLFFLYMALLLNTKQKCSNKFDDHKPPPPPSAPSSDYSPMGITT